MKKILIIFLGLFLVTSCKTNVENIEPKEEIITETSEFSKYSIDDSYDLNSILTPTLSNNKLLINQGGTYYFSGNIDNQIYINTSKDENVQLVFDNITYKQEDTFVYSASAKNVKITLIASSNNVIETTNTHQDTDGALYSKTDLIINGMGTLTVTSNSSNGIVSKDDLIIVSSTINIKSLGHGLEANDSLRFKSATLNIVSGKDGIQSDHNSDITKGYVYGEDSVVTIKSSNDGIQASSDIFLQSGSYDIKTLNGSTSSNQEVGNNSSYKALKADQLVYIKSGNYLLNSADDAIHSNKDIIIDGGNFEIYSKDDGIHADNSIIINGGTLNIKESYEGLEAALVTINAGEISIISSDDGINASNGSTTSRPGVGNSKLKIIINGGITQITAGGDGIDSNGDIEVNGGLIYASAKNSGADSGLDYDGKASITKGTVVITGSNAMAQNFSSASQGSLLLFFKKSYTKNSLIQVKNSNGKLIIDTVALQEYNTILLSDESFVLNDKLEITLDNESQIIELNTLLYSNASSGFGQRPDQNTPNRRP